MPADSRLTHGLRTPGRKVNGDLPTQRTCTDVGSYAQDDGVPTDSGLAADDVRTPFCFCAPLFETAMNLPLTRKILAPIKRLFFKHDALFR